MRPPSTPLSGHKLTVILSSLLSGFCPKRLGRDAFLGGLLSDDGASRFNAISLLPRGTLREEKSIDDQGAESQENKEQFYFALVRFRDHRPRYPCLIEILLDGQCHQTD